MSGIDLKQDRPPKEPAGMTSDPIDVFGPFDDLITQPLEPTVLNNAVVVIGLGPVALAMTADAAEISGLRLMDAAAKAREKF